MKTSTLLALLTLTACGSNDAGMNGGSGALGVAQGGANDFGYFRQILLKGEVPGPDTIDAVGFFAEHKIELPEALCGEDVCVYGELGMMGNMISGSDCTTIAIAMNTPITEFERPPLHLVLALDLTYRGSEFDKVMGALGEMADHLEPEDTVSVVLLGEDNEVRFDMVAADDPLLHAYFQHGSNERINVALDLYDGVRLSMQQALDHYDPERQNRVVLISDGNSDAGILSDARIVSLAEAYGDEDIGMSTIGIGGDANSNLLGELAVAARGTFTFVEHGEDAADVLVEQAETFLVSLAEDAIIELDVAEQWDLVNVYGATDVTIDGNQATLDLGSLHIATRTSVDDTEDSRRGGGGAIVVEVLPRSTVDQTAEIGTMTMRYTTTDSGERVDQTVEIRSSEEPDLIGENGLFESFTAEKAFVMLNVYAGFEIAAESAQRGDFDTAYGVLVSLEAGLDSWLVENPDADIEDDQYYVGLFIDNVEPYANKENTEAAFQAEFWWPSD